MRRILVIVVAALLAVAVYAKTEKAPDFASDAVWIDTGPAGAKVPHTISGYRGHVLLIDFWEYTCINCIRDFGVLKSWYGKYHPFGFDIVGVHYGEFAIGFSPENVRQAAKRFQLPWPVVADIHGSIWNAYHSDVWPNRFVIDQAGNIVLHVEGETGDRQMEEKIRELLAASNPAAGKIALDPPENAYAPECGIPTQETYVGDWFGRGALENPGGYRDGSTTDFRATRAPDDGSVILGGQWRTEQDGVISAANQGRLELRYHARSLYSVLSLGDAKKPVRVYLLQDGKPLAKDEAGVDVRFDSKGSYIDVSEPRMYYLVKNAKFGSHLVTIEAQGGGLDVHSFTYGNNCQQDFQQS